MRFGLAAAFGKCAILVLAVTTVTATARAAIIQEQFTITIGSPSLPMATEVMFPSSAVPLFNPTLGTLNNVSTTLAGSANYGGGSIDIDLQIPGGPLVGANFGSSPINFNSSDTNDTLAAVLAAFRGTGTTVLDLEVFADNGGPLTTTADWSGTVTYNFTPTSTGVPEPASLSLLGAALLGFGAIRRRRKSL